MARIELKDVTYRYPYTKSPALKHITYTFEPGKFYGIIGENGGGKTTLCNLLRGLIPHFYQGSLKGDVIIDGTDVRKWDTDELSAQIGSARLSFAEPEDMLKYLDIEPGAVSIMGLMNDSGRAVQLLIDEDVLRDEYIGCHPCVCTSSLKIRTEDILNRFLPAVRHGYRTVHLLGEE